MGRLGTQKSHTNALYSGVLKCKKCKDNTISIHKGTFVPPCRCGGTKWEYQAITQK